MSVYVYTHGRVCVYMYMYVCTGVYVHVCICTCVYMYMCVYVHVCLCMYLDMSVYVYKHGRVCVYMYMCICVCMCVERMGECYMTFQAHRALELIMRELREANAIFQLREPWSLAKQDLLSHVIYTTMETLCVCSILFQPVNPILAPLVLNSLSLPPSQQTLEASPPLGWTVSPPG